jgi:hypothetical protein
MKRNRSRLVIGAILTTLGILGIFSPAIFEYIQQLQPVPPFCETHPCLQPPSDTGGGIFWVLGIVLFAVGIIIIARSRGEIIITRTEMV